MKYSSKRILVGIDDSESSIHVLEYVADLARGNGDFVVHAFHAVGPVPLIGGEAAAVKRLDPIFQTLAPGQ